MGNALTLMTPSVGVRRRHLPRIAGREEDSSAVITCA